MPSQVEHTQDDSVSSEQCSHSQLYPPQTVLIRWEGELLLMDAWDSQGRGLRTPPSLIAEAAVHYGLDIKIEDLRLCIREKLDGKPKRFFLGISALRFIEDGRVLELVDIRKYRSRRSQSHTSAETSPVTALECHENEETTSDPSHNSSEEYYSSPGATLSDHKGAETQLSPKPSHKSHRLSGQYLRDDNLEYTQSADQATYIHIHRHLGGIRDYSHKKRTPVPTPSHSPTRVHIHSGPTSRSQSRHASPSRRFKSMLHDNDLWLGEEGFLKWERENSEHRRGRSTAVSSTHSGTTRSHSHVQQFERLPRPHLLSRTHSNASLPLSSDPGYNRRQSAARITEID